ncbi:HAD family hydrolase [Streptomyces fumanus]|uniref:HAD family hydrolase n=1 Tax=Streptomyces fumanus TaxID=67302 RepID=UPI0034039A23
MATHAHPLLGWSSEAVVLDCDGTLMDSERHWQVARNRAFREFGLTPPPGFADRAKGVYYADCGRLMAEETHKPELADDLARCLLEHFLSLVADDPATMPGAVEFVRILAGRLPLAVASNCPREVVEESLSRAGLLRHFAHVVVPTQVPGSSVLRAVPDGSDPAVPEAVRPKPWPDVYATAARLCGTEPERALAVEDSLTGIEAARRAGLRVLGVGPRPSREDASRADLWVTALHSPELLAWARQQGPRQTGTPTT